MLFTQKLHSDLMVCGDSTLCNYNIRSDNAVCNIIYLSGQEVLGGKTPWTFPPIEEMLCGVHLKTLPPTEGQRTEPLLCEVWGSVHVNKEL